MALHTPSSLAVIKWRPPPPVLSLLRAKKCNLNSPNRGTDLRCKVSAPLSKSAIQLPSSIFDIGVKERKKERKEKKKRKQGKGKKGTTLRCAWSGWFAEFALRHGATAQQSGVSERSLPPLPPSLLSPLSSLLYFTGWSAAHFKLWWRHGRWCWCCKPSHTHTHTHTHTQLFTHHHHPPTQTHTRSPP